MRLMQLTLRWSYDWKSYAAGSKSQNHDRELPGTAWSVFWKSTISVENLRPLWMHVYSGWVLRSTYTFAAHMCYGYSKRLQLFWTLLSLFGLALLSRFLWFELLLTAHGGKAFLCEGCLVRAIEFDIFFHLTTCTSLYVYCNHICSTSAACDGFL